jgi:hypothetical protein
MRELLWQSGDWNDFNRNFTLARECIKIAVKEGMMPPLLIGKKKDEVIVSYESDELANCP